jgi:hypothetical protein
MRPTRKSVNDRHHAPRTRQGLRILANRIRDVYSANGIGFRRDGELVNCVLRSRSRTLDTPEGLGEQWAERHSVAKMVRALYESDS